MLSMTKLDNIKDMLFNEGNVIGLNWPTISTVVYSIGMYNDDFWDDNYNSRDTQFVCSGVCKFTQEVSHSPCQPTCVCMLNVANSPFTQCGLLMHVKNLTYWTLV